MEGRGEGFQSNYEDWFRVIILMIVWGIHII